MHKLLTIQTQHETRSRHLLASIDWPGLQEAIDAAVLQVLRTWRGEAGEQVVHYCDAKPPRPHRHPDVPPPGRIRNDGMLHTGFEPSSPAVILSFASKHGPLRLPCDRFKEWRDNLRAIAYHLEHLRMSALYGVGRLGEQYRGWNALPPAIPLAMSVEEAARTLAKLSGIAALDCNLISDPIVYRSAWRLASKQYHPDANGGDVLQEWHTLQQVKAVLEKHHNL